MADRPQMFGPTRGFSGMADSMEPCKMLGADPCCHGNEICARRGDPVAYRLVVYNCRCTYCLSDILHVTRMLLLCVLVVFMGSRKYQNDNDFDEYVSEHGGSSNAFTECEQVTIM